MHYRTAQQMLQTDYASYASEAGKQLLQAASIFDMLHANISNTKWDRKFHAKEANPPECSAAVCAAMSFYCRSRAQATALVKAIVENKMSAMVKSRLCLGICHLSSQAIDTLVASIPAYVKKEAWVVLPFLAAIGGDRETSRAIAQHFLALHCADDAVCASVGGRQLGQALSCQAYAKVLLQEQRFPYYEATQGGLPKVSQFPYTGLTHLTDIVQYLQASWDENAPVWDRENRMIYFQPQPRSVDEYVVPIPAEAIVANPSTFKDVEPLIIPFIDPPKAVSVFSAFFNGFKSSNSSSSNNAAGATAATAAGAEGAATAPDGSLLSASMLTGDGVPDQNNNNSSGGGVGGRELTDEEFARELHRRLNLDNSSNNSNNSNSNSVAPSAPPAAAAHPR